MQTDPIGYGDGLNMYAYVGNDPVNARDPSGMCSSRRGVMGGAMCQVICFNERDCGGGGGERNNQERGGGGECKICNNAPPKPPFNVLPHHAEPQDIGRLASLGGWNALGSFTPISFSESELWGPATREPGSHEVGRFEIDRMGAFNFNKSSDVFITEYDVVYIDSSGSNPLGTVRIGCGLN